MKVSLEQENALATPTGSRGLAGSSRFKCQVTIHFSRRPAKWLLPVLPADYPNQVPGKGSTGPGDTSVEPSSQQQAFVACSIAALPKTQCGPNCLVTRRGRLPATTQRQGRFRTVANGEPCSSSCWRELPGDAGKVVRVLQERQFERLGDGNC